MRTIDIVTMDSSKMRVNKESITDGSAKISRKEIRRFFQENKENIMGAKGVIVGSYDYGDFVNNEFKFDVEPAFGGVLKVGCATLTEEQVKKLKRWATRRGK